MGYAYEVRSGCFTIAMASTLVSIAGIETITKLKLQ